MARIPLDIVDAFADRPLGGNPAAIIPEASGLPDEVMLQISDELGMEVGFVLPPTEPGADVRLRFFTPRHEAMLSGHVTVAAFTALADRGVFRPTAEGLELMQQTHVGVLPVVLTRGPDGATQVTFELPAPRFFEPVPAHEVAAAFDLPPAMVGIGEHVPQRVSCGFDVLVVPIADRAAARGRYRDYDAIRRLADRLGVGGIACFSTETSSPRVDLFCRFFHPSEGRNEDCVSGTSLGAIAAYCLHKKIILSRPLIRIISEQGHLLGRPSRAVIEAQMTGSHIRRLRLAARGVLVLRGELNLREGVEAKVV